VRSQGTPGNNSVSINRVASPHLSLMRSRLNLISLSARFPLKRGRSFTRWDCLQRTYPPGSCCHAIVPCDMLVSLYSSYHMLCLSPNIASGSCFLAFKPPSNHLQTTHLGASTISGGSLYIRIYSIYCTLAHSYAGWHDVQRLGLLSDCLSVQNLNWTEWTWWWCFLQSRHTRKKKFNNVVEIHLLCSRLGMAIPFLLLTRDVLRLCITYHYYLFFYVSSIDFDSHSFTQSRSCALWIQVGLDSSCLGGI